MVLLARQSAGRRGDAGSGAAGEYRKGVAQRGLVKYGWHGATGFSPVVSGTAWLGVAGKVTLGRASLCVVGQSAAGMVWRSTAWRGCERCRAAGVKQLKTRKQF